STPHAPPRLKPIASPRTNPPPVWAHLPAQRQKQLQELLGQLLARLHAANVYVRQSTPQQVLDHKESTVRQYALADRAVALGWPRDRVVTIDDDLGKSG